MNASDTAKALLVVDLRQKEKFEKAGVPWLGPMCEAAAAKILQDAEYLKDAWALADCKGGYVLDHKDNDSTHNPINASNHQRLCRSHNVRKNPPNDPRRANRFLGYKELKQSQYRNTKKESDTLGEHEWALSRERMMPATMKKNRECEPLFRKAVKILISKYGRMKRKAVLDAACEKSGCVQCTGANYLDKLCSVFGEYEYEMDPDSNEVLVREKGNNASK